MPDDGIAHGDAYRGTACFCPKFKSMFNTLRRWETLWRLQGLGLKHGGFGLWIRGRGGACWIITGKSRPQGA